MNKISRSGISATGDTSGSIRRFSVATVTLLLLIGSLAWNKTPDINKAEVNQVQGIFIFTDCKPLSSYTYLGTINHNTSSWNPQYTNVRDKIIDKVRKQYPQADGIIFYLNSGGADKADAIKMQP